MKLMQTSVFRGLVGLVTALIIGLCPMTSLYADQVSKPGEYSGYSEPIYTEWVRNSQYVEVRDGTKLAVDIYRPAIDGVAVATPYPVLWEHTPYRRASFRDDGSLSLAGKGYADYLTPYGYVVAVVDTRGMGASYGTRRGMQDRTEAWDAYDITEWFAAQPWCDGQVGMWGCSYNGGSVYQAVTTMPPHLKAVLPGCSDFDKWEFVRRGGILAQFNTRPDDPSTEYVADYATAPVDEDVDADDNGLGDMLEEAVAMHQYNDPMAATWKSMPYRDSVVEADLNTYGSQFWLEVSPSTYLEETNNSNAAFYHWGSFHDNGRLETIMNYVNVDRPDKMLLSPEGHCNSGTVNILAEHLRFYDYWLKDIPNGIMEEPPIYYYKMGPEDVEGWQYAWTWPLPNEKRIKLYLNGDPSGSEPTSINDGSLTLKPPKAKSDSDAYEVDYDFTGNPCAGLYFLWEPCVIDEKGLTYTTAPLEADVEVTGHPVVRLWAASTHTDGNFFVYLEDVAPDGSVEIVTHGRLRASYRKLHKPPHNNIGLPWHRSYEEDMMPLTPGEPAELVLDLLPTSQIFPAGHRMRLTIAGADMREREIEVVSPAPVVSLYHDRFHRSSIELPITTKPIEPKVRIVPGALNLARNGSFTALITPPKKIAKGYRAEDIDISTVTCGGAPAVWGKVIHDTLLARFKIADLVNIDAGRKVTLKVEGQYHYKIPFEGSDQVRVTKAPKHKPWK